MNIPLPPPRSPMRYFQERHCMQVNGDWRVLCVAIMLNQTSGKQLEQVHERFFARYPGPRECAVADEETMAQMLKPLGFYNRRAKTLRTMSAQFYVGVWTEPEQLHGIGKYGADSYNLFVRGIVPEDLQDKELRRYVAWATEMGFVSPDATYSHEQVRGSGITDVSPR